MVELYASLKQNEIMKPIGKWVKIWILVVSKISHSYKDKCCIISLIYRI